MNTGDSSAAGAVPAPPEPTAPASTAAAPCLPCKAAAEARQFSLNTAATPALPDDAVPVVAEGVSITVGDAGVDISVDEQRSFSLNATAGLIWLTIDGRLDVAGIIADLANETGAPPEQIGPDVRGSIATFADQGLITVAPQG